MKRLPGKFVYDFVAFGHCHCRAGARGARFARAAVLLASRKAACCHGARARPQLLLWKSTLTLTRRTQPERSARRWPHWAAKTRP